MSYFAYFYFMKLELRDFLLLALFCYIVFLQMCRSEPNLPDLLDTTIVYYQPPDIIIPSIPISKPTIIYQPIPTEFDTAQVIQDYYAKREYANIHTTDSVEVIVGSHLFKNALDSQSVRIRYLFPPCSTSTITIHPTPRNKVYVGGSLSYGMAHADFNLMGGFVNKREQLYFVGYSPMSRSVQVGGMMKVRVRK